MDECILKRGWQFSKKSPTIEEVKEVMRSIDSDDEAPEFAIECFNRSAVQERIRSILRVFKIFKPNGDPLGWQVEFSFPNVRRSTVVLADTNPKEKFIDTIRCGAPAFFREDCLLNSATVLRACKVFVETGQANPDQTWLNQDVAMKDG